MTKEEGGNLSWGQYLYFPAQDPRMKGQERKVCKGPPAWAGTRSLALLVVCSRRGQYHRRLQEGLCHVNRAVFGTGSAASRPDACRILCNQSGLDETIADDT